MSERLFSFLGWKFLVRDTYVEARWPGRDSVSTWPKRPAKNGSGFYDLCRQIYREKPVVLTREDAQILAKFVYDALYDKPQDTDDEPVNAAQRRLVEALQESDDVSG